MATATTTAVAQLNRVQYAGLDFPTHFDDLRSELQTKFAADFNDFALSSLAIMLLDITAYGLDALSFYLDRRATDSYLETAQTRKAVSRLTRQLGYKMGGAISASTDLEISITQALNFTVTIPQGFQFKGPENLVFECAQAITYAPQSTTPQFVPVYEGETVVETFVGDGTASQVYELQAIPAGKNVVQGSVKVLVNGTPYTEADFLPITGGQYFEVGYNDSPATIRFGDGTVSQTDIPGPSSTISVTYIAATGLAGQVNANTITDVVVPLVVNFTTVPLSITNPEAAVGGDDPESLSRAKTLAPLVYKSRRVAVTQDDYVSLASAFADPLFGRVAVAQAYSTRSAADDLTLQALLQDVRDVVSPIYTTVDAQLGLLGVETTNITAQLAVQNTALGDVGTSTTAINAALATNAVPLMQGVSNTANLAVSRCTAGAVAVGTVTTAVGVSLLTTASYVQPAVSANVTVSVASITGLTIGQTVSVSTGGTTQGIYTVVTVPTLTSVQLNLTSIPVGGTIVGGTVATSSNLTSAPVSALALGDKTELTTLFNSVSSDVASMQADNDNSLGYVETALDETALIGLSTASGYLQTLETARASIAASNTLISGTISPAIALAIDPIDPTGSGTGSINAALDAIEDHVDQILAANCSANLVTVPILTRDANGFYVAPSLGLRVQLQSYLDARKAVTQNVAVVSGEASLVYSVLTLQVSVRQGYSESVVRVAVLSAIDGLLKNRAFGVSLYRSDIVETVLSVDGTYYVNPTIDGFYTSTNTALQTNKLDGYGNLIVDENEVVTKGTVAVTTVLSN